MLVKEAFDLWYTTNYWNWMHNISPARRLSFFNVEKDQYNHMDVDLAYQAFKKGYEIGKANT